MSTKSASIASDEIVLLSRSDEKIIEKKGFKFKKKLNEGAFSKVLLFDYNDGSELPSLTLACKFIDTRLTDEKFKTTCLKRELHALVNCQHPHIVYVHSIYQRHERYFIFMRYAENGDLFDYLQTNGPLCEERCALWLRQIALALQYLHTLDIAHRDLKCENVLITAHFNAKLTDFGFVRATFDTKTNQSIMSRTYCGSASYAAPEIIAGKPYYPKMADLWSVGVLIFTMLNKANPFDSTNLTVMYEEQIKRNYEYRTNLSASLSQAVQNLVDKLLEPEPELRLTIDEVLNDQWLQMYSFNLFPLTRDEELALESAKQHRNKVSDKFRVIFDTVQTVLRNAMRMLLSDGFVVVKEIADSKSSNEK